MAEKTNEHEYGQPYLLITDGKRTYFEVSPAGELRLIESDFEGSKLEKISRGTAIDQLAARNL